MPGDPRVQLNVAAYVDVQLNVAAYVDVRQQFPNWQRKMGKPLPVDHRACAARSVDSEAGTPEALAWWVTLHCAVLPPAWHVAPLKANVLRHVPGLGFRCVTCVAVVGLAR